MRRADASNGLTPIYAAVGRLALSVDGVGTLTDSGMFQVDKPRAGTVQRAYLLSASTGFSGYTPSDDDVTLNGLPVAWDPLRTVPTSIGSYNVAADVTGLVSGALNAAPAGQVSIPVTEANSYQLDGELLAVVWNAPDSRERSVYLMYGALSTTGDSFSVGLSEPLKPSSTAQMSLGISYGYQQGDTGQFSEVAVNGTRLTRAAGGEDDRQDPSNSADGALLTAGGIDDLFANPADPNVTTGCGLNERCDDEAYDLKDIVGAGATSFDVTTLNPSNDDNVFFAGFDIAGVTASIGSSLTVSPSGTTQQVGTSHELIARAQDAEGDPVPADVTFTVVDGPNEGATFGGIQQGDEIRGSYVSSETGIDTIVASYEGTDGVVTSNVVTQKWIPAVTGTFGGAWTVSGDDPLTLYYSYAGDPDFAGNVSQAASNWNNSTDLVDIRPWPGSPAALHVPVYDVDLPATWWGMAVFREDCFSCGYEQVGIALNERQLGDESDAQKTKVTTHEFGHVLGLAHTQYHRNATSSTPSVMWQGLLSSTVKNSPQFIDDARIEALYGDFVRALGGSSQRHAPNPRYRVETDHPTYEDATALQQDADTVVEGTVIDAEVVVPPSPGVDAAGDPLPVVPETRYTVDVSNVIADDDSQTRRAVKRVSPTITVVINGSPDVPVEGTPDLNAGDDVLLYLAAGGGSTYYPLAGGAAAAKKVADQYTFPSDVTGSEQITLQIVNGEVVQVDGPATPAGPDPVETPGATAERPAISGTPVIGGTLTVTDGKWDQAIRSFAYQWFRDGQSIPGATSRTYSPTAADAGRSLTAAVFATSFNGLSGSSVAEPVTIAIGAAPTATTAPTLSGTPAIGQTLTVSPGTWSSSKVTFGYQWLLDGSPIGGATGTSLLMDPTYVGKSISARVTASEQGYADGSATTAAVTVAKGLAPAATTAPVISGDAELDKVVRVSDGEWSTTGLTFTYQWLRDGSPIEGATKSYYKVVRADVGAELSATVEAVKDGTEPGSATAAPVAVPKLASSIAAKVLKPKKPRYPGRARIEIDVDSGDRMPAGDVVVRTADGTEIGRVTLEGNSSSMRRNSSNIINYGVRQILLTLLDPGQYQLVVEFLGNDLFAGSTADLALKIRNAKRK